MADQGNRENERQAAQGDSEAQTRAERDRCRRGECCAHSHDWPEPSIPGPPGPAREATIIIEGGQWTMHRPTEAIRDRGQLVELRALDDPTTEATITLVIAGPERSAYATLHWLQQVFEIIDQSTGVADTRSLGKRLVRPGDKEFKHSIDWRRVGDQWVMVEGYGHPFGQNQVMPIGSNPIDDDPEPFDEERDAARPDVGDERMDW